MISVGWLQGCRFYPVVLEKHLLLTNRYTINMIKSYMFPRDNHIILFPYPFCIRTPFKFLSTKKENIPDIMRNWRLDKSAVCMSTFSSTLGSFPLSDLAANLRYGQLSLQGYPVSFMLVIEVMRDSIGITSSSKFPHTSLYCPYCST